MTTYGYVLAVLLAATPHTSDRTEDPAARRARLGVLAESITAAAETASCATERSRCEPIWSGTTRELAAYLLTVGQHESHWAGRVHRAQCLAWECDRGRARSPWQFQRWGAVRRYWDLYRGDDLQSTIAGAWAATLILSRARRACTSPAGVFAYYHRGSCVPVPEFRRGAYARSRTMHRLLGI